MLTGYHRRPLLLELLLNEVVVALSDWLGQIMRILLRVATDKSLRLIQCFDIRILRFHIAYQPNRFVKFDLALLTSEQELLQLHCAIRKKSLT